VFRADVAKGGLMCYGPDTADLFERAASYVDRILKGEKLPIFRCKHQSSSS
jgi:hypothetical protein